MPVRKRSPTSGNSSVYTTTQPTFTTLPENPQTSFQTMRQVNPDGTSTVYHVHDSINNGGLPPQVILGGGGGGIPLQQTHHIMSSQQQQAPISGGIVYPYGQQQQPNIVYVQSDEYSDSDESDNEESAALVQHNQSQSPKNKKRIKCCLNSKSTSTICILTSIIFAISFIVGYIFLIDAIVTNNRNNHSSNPNYNVSPGSSLRIGSRAYRGGIPSHIQHQQDEEGGKVYNTPLNSELEEKLGLTEKYYVVKPMISEISINKLPTSSEGGVVGGKDNNLGGMGTSQQQQYQRPVQVDKQQHNQLVQEPRNGEVVAGGSGNHMKDVIEEQKQQETRTVPGIVPRGSEISRDGPVRRRR